MSGNTTLNTQAFIEAEQYSEFILTQLHDGLLPDNLYRNVSDFGSGETLNIKTIGSVSIQDVSEDTPIIFDPIDTGQVQLQITEYAGKGWYVTDKLRQDGSQIESLLAQQGVEVTRAIQENFETVYLKALDTSQTASNPNLINGFAHRSVASGTNQTMELQDIINQKLAFDKANVPYAGRIAIVDPVVAATLNQKFQGTYNVNSNPQFQSLLENGFDKEHQFIMNLFGFDIWSSNRLNRAAASTNIDGTVSLTNEGVANVFMSVLNDNTKPLMIAWRQMPRVEGERDIVRQRDKFVETARWGVGAQRKDTLSVVYTDAQAIS